MKVGGIKTWKELATCVQQLVRLLFNNDFVNPGLFLYDDSNEKHVATPVCELSNWKALQVQN